MEFINVHCVSSNGDYEGHDPIPRGELDRARQYELHSHDDEIEARAILYRLRDGRLALERFDPWEGGTEFRWLTSLQAIEACQKRDRRTPSWLQDLPEKGMPFNNELPQTTRSTIDRHASEERTSLLDRGEIEECIFAIERWKRGAVLFAGLPVLPGEDFLQDTTTILRTLRECNFPASYQEDIKEFAASLPLGGRRLLMRSLLSACELVSELVKKLGHTPDPEGWCTSYPELRDYYKPELEDEDSWDWELGINGMPYYFRVNPKPWSQAYYTYNELPESPACPEMARPEIAQEAAIPPPARPAQGYVPPVELPRVTAPSTPDQAWVIEHDGERVEVKEPVARTVLFLLEQKHYRSTFAILEEFINVTKLGRSVKKAKEQNPLLKSLIQTGRGRGVWLNLE